MQIHGKAVQSSCPGNLSEVEFAAVAGLLDAHALLQKHLHDQLQQHHELLPTEYEMLSAISRSETACVRMTELAQSARLSISGMSRLANRLEKRGIVRRESSPDDGRGWNLALTEAGVQLMAAARETHIVVVREHFLRYLTAEDFDHLVSVWRKLPLGTTGCS